MASSPSTSLGSPLVQSSHGTSANIGTGDSIGSLRTGAGTNTLGLVGRPSSSPDWGQRMRFPMGKLLQGRGGPSGFKTC